jgi:hypothetical protein
MAKGVLFLFYSRKLLPAEMNYSTPDNNLVQDTGILGWSESGPHTPG